MKKSLFKGRVVIAILVLAFVIPGMTYGQCKRPQQGQRSCYCANVSAGYSQCDCGPYGFCEDCTVSGTCGGGGGGGDWDIDYQDWWWVPWP